MNPYAMTSMYNNNNMYNSYPCGCIRQNNNNYAPKNFPYEWSRMGPMGGLMEPKLIYVPPNPNADIEVETNIRTKISQNPNGFMNMQFPMPRPDLLHRINHDRLRTTYQNDFCSADNFPMVIDYGTWVYNQNKKARLANMQRNEFEKACRPLPKPPYIGGHEIPGRKRKDLSFTAPEKKSNGRKRSSQVSSRLSRASKDQKQKNDKLESLQKPKIDKRLESRINKKKNDEAEVEVASSNFEDKESDSLKNSSNDLENKNSLNEEEENNKESDDKKSYPQESDDKINNNDEDNINSSSYNSASSCESKNKNINNDNETYIHVNYSNRRRKYTVDLGNENFDVDILPWLSEYQDSISGTGDEILRTKLHYYGKLRLLPDYIAYKKKQADKKKDTDKKNKAKNESL